MPVVAIIVAGLVIMCMIGALVINANNDKKKSSVSVPAVPAATPTQSATPSPTQKPSKSPSPSPTTDEPAVTISGDGIFLVGSEVEPGSYRTTVPNASIGCYWARLSGLSGEFDDIIANGIGEPGAQQVVEIASEDEAFETEGCGTWELLN